MYAFLNAFTPFAWWARPWVFVVIETRPAVNYILWWSPPPSLPIPITTGCVAVVVIVIVELPPEFTRSRAAIFTSTKFRLRVASPPWIRVGLEMTILPRAGGVCELSDMGKQHNKLTRAVSAGSEHIQQGNCVRSKLSGTYIWYFYMICSGSAPGDQSECVETGRKRTQGGSWWRQPIPDAATTGDLNSVLRVITRLVTADRRFNSSGIGRLFGWWTLPAPVTCVFRWIGDYRMRGR